MGISPISVRMCARRETDDVLQSGHCAAVFYLPTNLKVWCIGSRMKPGTAVARDDESDEKEAIEAFLSTRSEVAFGRLAAALFARLVRYFSIRGLDAPTAEELAQDVL